MTNCNYIGVTAYINESTTELDNQAKINVLAKALNTDLEDKFARNTGENTKMDHDLSQTITQSAHYQYITEHASIVCPAMRDLPENMPIGYEKPNVYQVLAGEGEKAVNLTRIGIPIVSEDQDQVNTMAHAIKALLTALFGDDVLRLHIKSEYESLQDRKEIVRLALANKS